VELHLGGCTLGSCTLEAAPWGAAPWRSTCTLEELHLVELHLVELHLGELHLGGCTLRSCTLWRCTLEAAPWRLHLGELHLGGCTLGSCTLEAAPWRRTCSSTGVLPGPGLGLGLGSVSPWGTHLGARLAPVWRRYAQDCSETRNLPEELGRKTLRRTPPRPSTGPCSPTRRGTRTRCPSNKETCSPSSARSGTGGP